MIIRQKTNVLILAGNAKQFTDYDRLYPTTTERRVYAQGPDSIRGIRFDEMRVIGTFWNRRDALALHDFGMQNLTQEAFKKYAKSKGSTH